MHSFHFGSRSATLGILFAACATLAQACGSNSSNGVELGNGATGSTGNSSGSGNQTGQSGGGATLSFGGSTGSGAGSTGVAGGNGMPEVCDGIDNNGDGIIDNVDANGDGICDCIRIATLGIPGTWGQGDVFGTWLNSRATPPYGVTSLNAQTLTADLLRPFEIVVAQDVSQMAIGRAYTAAEVAALQAWVQGGGGLMTLIGFHDPSELSNVNMLLKPFAMSYGNTQILQKSGSSTVPITDFSAHPITQGIMAVGVDNGYPVQGTGTVYARGGGYNVGLAQNAGSGHVDVWGDEWITYDSEWQNHPDYQVPLFWVNSIKWLTPANICQVPIPPVIR